MPIRHKFENKPPDVPAIAWTQGFATENAILSTTPYEPEVIIIGSFNHGWPWNDADFFYGRDMYMWTVMANLFLNNANLLVDRRNPPPGNNMPSLNQIFDICKRGKLCFADVILGLNTATPTVVNIQNQSVLVNGAYNWDSYKDGQLNQIGMNGLLNSNVQNIINYLNNTPSIKHIYFTFATGGAWLVGLKDTIINTFPNHQRGSIYTPTGMRLPNFPGYPNRPFSLAHHWVWNNAGHPVSPVNNPNYINLDHEWLIRNGVNPNNF
jgi:hypothetical protein